jgi:hypothetical protein
LRFRGLDSSLKTVLDEKREQGLKPGLILNALAALKRRSSTLHRSVETLRNARAK